MEYEEFEPDPSDEYYDEMCSAAYAAMFNNGRNYNADYLYVYDSSTDSVAIAC